MSIEADELYKQFLLFEEANSVIGKIDRIRNPHQSDSLQRIRGEIFELFACRTLAKSLPPINVLLTPEETTEVYCRLYKNITPERVYDLNTGLMHISFPDGLILKPSDRYWKIAGLAEYKFTSQPKEIGEQIPHYTNLTRIATDLGVTEPQGRDKLGWIINDIRPDIPAFPVMLDPHYRLQYVLTQDIPPSSIPNHLKIDVNRTPFSGKDFWQFVDLMVDDVVATREEAYSPSYATSY